MNVHVVLIVGEKIDPRHSNSCLYRFCGISSLRLLWQKAISLQPKSCHAIFPTLDQELTQELQGADVNQLFFKNNLQESVLPVLSSQTGPEDAILFLDTAVPLVHAKTLRHLLRCKQSHPKSLIYLTACHSSSPRSTDPPATEDPLLPIGIFCADLSYMENWNPSGSSINPLRRDAKVLPPDGRGRKKTLDSRFQIPATNRWGSAFPLATLHVHEGKQIQCQEDLVFCEAFLRQQKAANLIKNGIRLPDPASTHVDWECRIGRGSVLYPWIRLEGKSSIGTHSTIRSFCRITDCHIGSHTTILEGCVLESSRMKDHCRIGPFAHLRSGVFLQNRVQVGNFVEIKNSSVGRATKALHLSYIGDAQVGKGVNVGAGTITCNFDGYRKNTTIIEDGVFLGSDSQMIAPVHIGKGAFIAAGSTITADVPAHALAIARGRQINKADWCKKRHTQRKSKP